MALLVSDWLDFKVADLPLKMLLIFLSAHTSIGAWRRILFTALRLQLLHALFQLIENLFLNWIIVDRLGLVRVRWWAGPALTRATYEAFDALQWRADTATTSGAHLLDLAISKVHVPFQVVDIVVLLSDASTLAGAT